MHKDRWICLRFVKCLEINGDAVSATIIISDAFSVAVAAAAASDISIVIIACLL